MDQELKVKAIFLTKNKQTSGIDEVINGTFLLAAWLPSAD